MSAVSSKCQRCGADPAAGFATIGDDRYCHGESPGRTCYELQQLETTLLSAPARDGFMSHVGRPEECPAGPHRGPQGPNEDIAQCFRCLAVSWWKRPAGETFGNHLADCSLPIDHESYCQPGGSGHPPAAKVRG